MKTHYNLMQPHFGMKFETAKVLEVTTQRVFSSDGLSGSKEVISALTDNLPKAIGNRGFKYYASAVGKRITQKYPEIKKATDEINSIIEKNPYIKKEILNTRIQPIIEKLGKEVDITI